MTPEESALARINFRLKIHEAKGQSFEDLFVKLYQLANPNFVSVKPQGQFGDRKNDGYDKSTGTYFQVYAPEDLLNSQADAVKKLKTDFEGLLAYWSSITPIRSFFFVMNDKYNGTFPTIEKDLADIKHSHKLAKCESLLARHLEDTLFQLSDDKIIFIVGYIPSPERISTLDYSILNSVIKHIVEYNRTVELNELLQAPDFSEKIEFNDLSPHIGALLWSGGNQVGIFDAYFAKNSTFAKQQVRDHLNRIYLAAKKKEYKASLSPRLTISDHVFMDILTTASPRTTQEFINATLVVMAAFFEACDIFEEPIHTV